MPTCPQLAYTLDTGPVPGHPTYTLRDFGSDLNAAKDTLYVHALDSTTALTWLALCNFPAMTQIGLHPGPIQLNRSVPFAVGPDGSVYNLYESASFSPAHSVHLEKWTSGGSLVYSVPTTGEVLPPTALRYNPVNDKLYGYADSPGGVPSFQEWEPSTGVMTTIALPSGLFVSGNAIPVITVDGTVWVRCSDSDHVVRYYPATTSWATYTVPFAAVNDIWHGPDANSVAVLDVVDFAWHKIDSAGTVTDICSDPIPSDLLGTTLIADDASIVLIEGTGHYYRWTGSGRRAGVGRVYIP